MRVTFGLGSNLGDRELTLRKAIDALRGAASGPVEVSEVVETDPVGGPEQPDYLNVVVRADFPAGTRLWPLADRLERQAGRERHERWGPRTLDVDILDADGATSPDPVLTLPHPRAHLRPFVLIPWAQLDPAATLPGHGRVADLLAGFPPAELAGVRPRPDVAV